MLQLAAEQVSGAALCNKVKSFGGTVKQEFVRTGVVL